jgi:hypothetical protein
VVYFGPFDKPTTRGILLFMKKLTLALVLALASIAALLDGAQAVGTLTASVSIPAVSYNGSGCIDAPATLSVSGGVSNGLNYWTTENETLSGPTSWPSPAHFFFDNEQAPATDTMTMCPMSDHPGVYTYSADVWYNDLSSGRQYAGHVSAQFTLGLAATTLAKVGRHVWQVRIVGQPYLVSYPHVTLQKRKGNKWRPFRRVTGNSAGKVALKAAAAGSYRLVYAGDVDRGFGGSTSKVFRRP